jgi:Cd2+/Zn2+-exporting ATPase
MKGNAYMERRTYKISGMDCADEVETLKSVVGHVSGVTAMDFNLLKGTMEVTVSDNKLDDAAILVAVRSTGMSAAPQDDESCPTGVCAVEPYYWQKNRRALLCGSSGLLVMAGFLSHALLHGNFIHALVEGNPGVAHRFPLISILFYAAAVLVGGWFIVPKAIAAARRMRPDMNLLMTIAVIGAMAIGEWLEAAIVTFLFALSLLLESWSVSRARRAIRSLLDLSPPTVRYICSVDGDIMEKPITEVPMDVTALVRPGERIPLDGIVTKGTTTINQAPITGESMPVTKGPGAEIFAGTINETGAIEFRVTRLTKDTTLARIIRMVEEAQSRRAPSEQWVTKFARYYTPLMVLLAFLVAIIPPLVMGGAWGVWFYQALVLLVIACPCALVISTPVSIVAALTSAARAGVLIKGGAFLEAAAHVLVVALDKTGTVTQGRPEVQQIVPIHDHTEKELLVRAAALEAHSEHPLAHAILRHAEARALTVPPADNFRAIKGKGAEASIQGRTFWLGSYRFADEKGMATPLVREKTEAMEEAGHSVIVIGNDQHVCGLISVADTIRKETKAAILEMKRVGICKVVMLTGDNAGTAQAVAKVVGIDEVRAELLPEDKLHAVEELVKMSGPTAMIGDGINDAPALAAATLGIAMGVAGTDAAIETADVALMSDNLMKVPWLFRHAQRTLRIVKQNIAFALSVKLVFMALALAKAATLWMAIAADMGASLVVIFNALRLLNGKQRR